VIVAGLYGGYSVSSRIIYVQAVPAVVALIFVWLANR
jgi:putative membrane protein